MNQQPQRKKQVGDWVVVTGGQNRGIAGEITVINHPRITVTTADGNEIHTTSGWLEFAKRPAKRKVEVSSLDAPVPASEPIDLSRVAFVHSVTTIESEPPVIEPFETVETTLSEVEPSLIPVPEPDVSSIAEPVSVPPELVTEQSSEPAPENATVAIVATNPYSEMTVVQLQLLAKERGISIARTKSDFVRILTAQVPDIDVTTLKGPELYNKVAEHHISRLRSKHDLVDLLSQGVSQ